MLKGLGQLLKFTVLPINRGSAVNWRFRFSEDKAKAPSIEQIRNINYKDKERKAIEEYNESIKIEKNRFNEEIKYYKELLMKAKNEIQKDKVEDNHDKFIESYTSKLNVHGDELKRKLKEIKAQEKTNTVKLYIAENLPSSQKKVKQAAPQSGMYIPNGLVIKKLYHSVKKGARQIDQNMQILLVGAEKDQQHCHYVAKLMEEFSIKQVITMVPPDLPYFIKTQQSYGEQWQKFIEDNDYAKKSKFYINPKPKCIKDIALKQHHIPLVRNSLGKSLSFMETHYCMRQRNQFTGQFDPNPLFSGLFALGVQQIYFADYPAFQQRKMIADTMQLSRLRELFQEHLRNFRKGIFNFSAQWLFPREVLSRKLNHLIGTVRAISETSEGRSMIVCPVQMAELISIQWQLKSKDSRLDYNYQDGNHYFRLGTQIESKQLQPFIEFVEKLVILDMIIDPIITKYFVKYRSFPFMCEHTIGGEENIGKIFIVWMHFYKIYYEQLSEKRLGQTDEHKKRLSQHEHPTNFT